ncbi:unnamed protein product [Lampetra fluviatilis]
MHRALSGARRPRSFRSLCRVTDEAARTFPSPRHVQVEALARLNVLAVTQRRTANRRQPEPRREVPCSERLLRRHGETPGRSSSSAKAAGFGRRERDKDAASKLCRLATTALRRRVWD